MSLHSTDSLIVEAATAAESLPDPTTVAFRTHLLVNTHSAAAVWSSVGATPFTEVGVNAATISVPRGQAKMVQSDGVRWQVGNFLAGQRKIYTATGVTNASGNVTFTFPVGFFSVAPVIGHAVENATTDLVEARITALSAASVTFNLRRAPSVTILGISVLTFPTNANGVTVHCWATPSGATP